MTRIKFENRAGDMEIESGLFRRLGHFVESFSCTNMYNTFFRIVYEDITNQIFREDRGGNI